jgi:hypothetical protein
MISEIKRAFFEKFSIDMEKAAKKALIKDNEKCYNNSGHRNVW